MAGGAFAASIDDPNGTNTYVFGIHDLEQLVGFYLNPNHVFEGFVTGDAGWQQNGQILSTLSTAPMPWRSECIGIVVQ